MTILSLHEAQAPNGQFSNNVLIENDHPEPPRGAPRGADSKWTISKQCSDWKWPFWASKRRRLRMVNYQTMFLFKISILSLHAAQASNGEFSNNVLIENDHSEHPRGAGSKWLIFKQCSYWKWPFWASMRRRLQMVNFQTMFLLKMTILSLHEAQAPNG